MSQVYLRVLGCLLALFLLVGAVACGDSGQPTTLTASSGFTTYTSSDEAFSIAVPSSWKTFSQDEIQSVDFSEFVEDNPQFAGVDPKLYSFVAIDPDFKGALPMSTNVVTVDVPKDAQVDDALQDVLASARSVGAVPGTLAHEFVELPAGRALRLDYHAIANIQGATEVGAVRQYLLAENGHAYFLTYVSTASASGDAAPIFDRSAASFRIN